MEKDENLEEKQDDKEDEVSEDEDILDAVREHQSKQNLNTCMISREPEAMVIENHTNKTITKKRKRTQNVWAAYHEQNLFGTFHSNLGK